MAKARIIGFDKVKANLDREIRAIKGRTLAGLIEASIIVRRSMSKTSPTVPIDTRNLDHSWFVVTSKGTAAGNSARFEGKNAGKMQADHNSVVTEQKSVVSSKKNPYLIMGFSANYAAFVHEMEGVDWSKQGSGGKFFESALMRNTPLILQTIGNKARIK